MPGKLNDAENNAIKEFKQKLLSSFGDRIKNILLFGSKARGDFNKDSDIDIFILVDKSDPALRMTTASFITEILLKHSILLSPKIIEESHYALLKQLQTAFIRNIEKEGVKI